MPSTSHIGSGPGKRHTSSSAQSAKYGRSLLTFSSVFVDHPGRSGGRRRGHEGTRSGSTVSTAGCSDHTSHAEVPRRRNGDASCKLNSVALSRGLRRRAGCVYHHVITIVSQVSPRLMTRTFGRKAHRHPGGSLEHVPLALEYGTCMPATHPPGLAASNLYRRINSSLTQIRLQLHQALPKGVASGDSSY